VTCTRADESVGRLLSGQPTILGALGTFGEQRTRENINIQRHSTAIHYTQERRTYNSVRSGYNDENKLTTGDYSRLLEHYCEIILIVVL